MGLFRPIYGGRLGAAICLSIAMGGAAAVRQQLEQGIKAAFIYHFTKYVSWPASSFASDTSPIVIGIVGRDSLGGELESAIDGKTAGGRRLVVRHLKWGQNLGDCQVLFVPSGEMGHAAELAHLKGKPVLTVGESDGFARNDGVVNFLIEANRVRFQINADAARKCGLTVSSKLLSLGLPPE